MSLFPETMRSERLQYQRLTEESLDLFELYQYVHQDAPHAEEITEYVTWDPYNHPKQARDWIQRSSQKWEAGESATYVLRPTVGDRSGDFAGLGGLHVDWDRLRGTLGIWLLKEFWGQGFAGERAGQFLELAFERLDLEIVRVDHHPENEKSATAIERYVERFGGRKEGLLRNEQLMNDEPVDVVRYSISQEEWRTATQRQDHRDE